MLNNPGTGALHNLLPALGCLWVYLLKESCVDRPGQGCAWNKEWGSLVEAVQWEKPEGLWKILEHVLGGVCQFLLSSSFQFLKWGFSRDLGDDTLLTTQVQWVWSQKRSSGSGLGNWLRSQSWGLPKEEAGPWPGAAALGLLCDMIWCDPLPCGISRAVAGAFWG